MARVGIPRGLLFFEYSQLIITFFKYLGADVIISNPTNKKIINEGTKIAVDDACIPVKIYHGHILNLKDRVDYLFVPRIIGLSKGDYICPKFSGLPEMISNSIDNLPKIINTTIDLTKSDKSLKNSILEIGHFISPFNNRIIASFESALNKYKLQKRYIKRGILPEDDIQNKKTFNVFDSKKSKIMILGHPYLIYDSYLNMNIIKKLREDDFDVITPEMFDENIIKEYANKYQGNIFWEFSRKLIGTYFYLVEKRLVDGVIYLSSFGCGIDSVVCETIERRIRKANIPFMLITLDEHTGQAGLNTRIEAFVDMMKWRNNNEIDVSTDGKHVYSNKDDFRGIRY